MNDPEFVASRLDPTGGLRCLPAWFRDVLRTESSSMVPADLASYRRQLAFLERHLEPLATPADARSYPPFTALCTGCLLPPRKRQQLPRRGARRIPRPGGFAPVGRRSRCRT